MKLLPPEIVQNVVEIITYLAAAAVGWIAKLLQGKNKKTSNK